MAKIAFVGLGVMGYPIARRIRENGNDVAVFNRTRSKARRWVDECGGRLAESPADAVEDAEVLITCVGNDEDLREVTLGENGGAYWKMKSQTIHIDHSTTSASVARELNRIASAKGISSIDAPVSGGQEGAQSGQLIAMVGAEREAFDRAESLMKCYCRAIGLVGPSGAGQLAKMVNQICIAGLIQGLAEGIHFAQKANLNVEHVIDLISKGAAQSWQMDKRHKTMAAREFDFGFAIEHARKDMAIALSEARNMGVALPVTALVDQFYAEVYSMGGRRWDTSSLIARLDRN